MPFMKSLVLSILVFFLSFSLLSPPISTTNSRLFGTKVNEEIRRNLIHVKPPPDAAHASHGHGR
ncbi:hypothetical protein ES288_A03G009000v1 [Gossypium darwinii]|uniref:Transmembrane protein n=1 Tax=Gossypium darwinii TaxID=34276 RepID=A0A5D2GZR9_GOSDA|nr:hypothetical protein ES288_A03G009000v1 [Gossypium darwinii]